jgi:hypothetical protein
VSCGKGEQVNQRSLKQEAMFGGTDCSSAVLTKMRECDLDNCSENIDCMWGEW